MKTDAERIATLDTIAETAAMLSNLGGFILRDIRAAQGEPEQERQKRPRLLSDVRDLDHRADEPEPVVNERTINYSDPTGTRATKDDPATRDLAEVDRRLVAMARDVDVVLRIFSRHQAARTPSQVANVRKVAEGELDTIADDWCRSHLRVGILEPITLRKGGKNVGAPYYKDQCKECGDLAGALRRDHPKRFGQYRHPPVELVAIRTHRKLRQNDIDALLGPQHQAEAKGDRQHPRHDRKRRSA